MTSESITVPSTMPSERGALRSTSTAVAAESASEITNVVKYDSPDEHPAREQQQHPQRMVEHLHAFADVPAEPVAGGGVLDGAKRQVRQLAEPGGADEDDEEEGAAEGDEEPATRHPAEYSLRRLEYAGGLAGGWRLAVHAGALERACAPSEHLRRRSGCTIPPPMKILLPLLLAMVGVSMSTPASAADSPATTMAAAAQTFLGSLDAAQKAKAQLPFDSEERFNWFYIPKDRVGLPLKQMTPPQREATMALLHAGLSEKGYTKAEAIRALEPVLAEIENNPVRRDPELYYVSIFGDPSPTGTWGWRYEGHHISQNWTVVRGQSIASSPQFFGSNPAEVRNGPKKGTRVLAAEEDLARALLERLTDAQRAKAVISAEAPDDMLTTNTRKAAIQEDRGPLARGADAGAARAADGGHRGVRRRAAARRRAEAPRGRARGGPRQGEVRVDGRPRARQAALLPHPGPDVPHRVRQHAERRQPHPCRVAGLQRRFRRGSALGALPHVAASRRRAGTTTSTRDGKTP